MCVHLCVGICLRAHCLCNPEEGVVSLGAGVTGYELPSMGPSNSALHYQDINMSFYCNVSYFVLF